MCNNNRVNFILALQCLSEDPAHRSLSQRDSPETVSDENLVYHTNGM